jgi:hypothetical protein
LSALVGFTLVYVCDDRKDIIKMCEGESRYHTSLSMRRWLAVRRVTDDAAGDLIADLKRDMRSNPDEFPRLLTIRTMRAHLLSRDACIGALEAAPTVWRRYQQWLTATRP